MLISQSQKLACGNYCRLRGDVNKNTRQLLPRKFSPLLVLAKLARVSRNILFHKNGSKPLLKADIDLNFSRD